MRSLTWYIRRTQGMSAGELTWRARSALRDAVDRYRLALGLYPARAAARSFDGDGEPAPRFRMTDVRVGEWASQGRDGEEAAWLERLVPQADRIARHRLSFFNLEDRHLGDPIDWNRDHESGRAAPLGFAPSIDYRDFRVTGDAKVVWEPNRHHHLVVLARAYRATGDVRYAAAVVEQMDSWLCQCPFGMGMNWRSPLELSIRLINWVWAVDLIRESGLIAGDLRARLLRAVSLHLWEIRRKYSRGSSANNHRIGEAAGVFIAASYWGEPDRGRSWREESRDILCQEILAQTYGDGCGREQALGYHLFILQFFLLAGITARRAGEDFPGPYWSRLERMLEFAGALTEGGGAPPMFGDCDDAYVLDLGGPHGDARGLLAVGAVLFGRSDLKTGSGGYEESARWLLGRSSRPQFEAIAPAPAEGPLASRAFPDSGYDLLQCGKRGNPDCVSVLFDCGELGFGPLAAHGHADALSFTLRAFGVDVFVDPGTYDYFSFPAWRDYFRSTRAHNTVVVDGADQSVMLGAFMWGARAQARCIRWAPRAQGGTVAGEHDGYTRLADPVVHRRTLNLDGASRTLTIQDEIVAREPHDVAVCFHLAEACAVSGVGRNRYRIAVQGGTVVLEVDPRLSVEALRGSEEPIGGWVSRRYHRKTPATTLIGRDTCQADTAFVCRIEIGTPA